MQTKTGRHKGRTAGLALGLLLIAALALAAQAFAAPARTVLVMGDSLSAAYGLSVEQGWVALLAKRLSETRPGWRVVNASVSGETTGGGRARFAHALEEHAPAIVILELGANDALRGIDPKEPGANLDKMLSALKSQDIPVLLTGMKAPNNWGDDYAKAFDAIYTDLATKYGVPLYPFFLDGVALDPTFSQPDGLHPTASGIAEIVKHIMPDVETLVQRISLRKTAAK